jgi:hypothetical protein
MTQNKSDGTSNKNDDSYIEQRSRKEGKVERGDKIVEVNRRIIKMKS